MLVWDSSTLGTWFAVFKLLVSGFICLCVGVVLYKVYKSKWNLPKYEDIAKLKKGFTFQHLKSLLKLSNIGRFLVKRVNKWLFEMILVLINWNINILFKFMGVLVIMVITEYLDIITKQYFETGKVDFSLAYSHMKNKLTLIWFIMRISTFLYGIFIKDKIFK